ncbi:MAG: EamA family transporter [Sulfurifustaceae bacterium]
MRIELLYTLVLLAALAHAIWNAMVKASHDRLLMIAAIRSVGMLFGVVVVTFTPLPHTESWPYLLAAAAVHYAYYGFVLQAYRVGDLNLVYPLARGTAPLIVAALAALFVGEQLGPWKVTAVLLVSIGILSLAFRHGPPRGGAVPYALATGAAIAGYTSLSGVGVRLSESPLAYAGWLEIATGVGMVLVALTCRGATIRPFVRACWRQGLTAGVLSVSGYVIALWAMVYLPIAPVAALRETSVVFAALIGTYKLREAFGLQRLTASCAVAFGVMLLTLPVR